MHHTLNPRATQYLSEKFGHTEAVLREDVPHMSFRTEGSPKRYEAERYTHIYEPSRLSSKHLPSTRSNLSAPPYSYVACPSSCRDPASAYSGFSRSSLALVIGRFACTDTRHTSMPGRVMVGQNHGRKGERPVAVYCFTQLIQPGKREEAKNIFEEIRGSRRSEYEASRRRLGIREEKGWFQGLPQGDMAVVNWAIRAALQEFASSDDPFDEWLKERGREVYHFEPSQTLEAEEEVFEAKVD